MDRQRLSPSVPMNHMQQQMTGYIPPQQGYPLPPNSFLPHQHQCIRVEVKLVNSKAYPDCNTDLSVVTIVKKPADTDVKTVAEFGRSLLTDCAPDWILKVARRHALMRKRTKGSIFLCFGGGYDLLVLLEGADVPKDISKVPRISVSTAISTKSEEARLGKENLPIASYSDGVWDHVSAMSTTFRGPPASAEMVAVLSDSAAPFGAIEGISDRVKVIRVWTQTKNIYEATRFDHTQNLDLSKMSVSSAEPSSLSKTKADTPPETAESKEPSSSTVLAATGTSAAKTAAATSATAKKADGSSLAKKTSAPSTKKTTPKSTTAKMAVPSPTKKTPISSPAKKTPISSPTKTTTTTAKPASSSAVENDAIEKDAPKAISTAAKKDTPKAPATSTAAKKDTPKAPATSTAAKKDAPKAPATSTAAKKDTPKAPATSTAAKKDTPIAPATSTAAKKDTPIAPATSTEQTIEAGPEAKPATAEAKKRGRPKGSKTKVAAKSDGEGVAASGDGPSPKKPKIASAAPPKPVEEEKSKTDPQKIAGDEKSTEQTKTTTVKAKKPRAKKEVPPATTATAGEDQEGPKKKKSRPNKLSGEVQEEAKKTKGRPKAAKEDE